MVRLVQGTYPSRHLEGLDQEPGYLLRVGSGYLGELMSECCVEFRGQLFRMPSQVVIDNVRKELQH